MSKLKCESKAQMIEDYKSWRAAMAAIVATLFAGMSGPAVAEEASSADGWRFNATAYAWFTSVSGNVTARGQTFGVNAGFFDIINNSSSIAAFNGYFEANKGPVGFYADLVWSNLGFPKSAARYRNPLPGLDVNGVVNAQLGYTMTIVEVGGIYEVSRWSHSPGSFTAADALLGFRYWNNSVAASLDAVMTADLYNLGFERSRDIAVAKSGNLEWVDPVVGFRVRHQFTPSQTAFLRGDIGGFGLGSLFSWQAVAAYAYSWQFEGYKLAATLGYRALATSYTTGAGIETRGVDLVLHGPLIGFSVKF
ncbi:hypothetical protein [Reyranella sp.]|uniref:hypothetical protein n=1 Tax=Reyranella sp. TaxID=1929291 RepID=UPI00121EBEFC|nr:hypothetical protein [Reyranella sp.]TAJ88352.1 MAG: hypothetical protein EPO50_09715 [Reyranella sp.]